MCEVVDSGWSREYRSLFCELEKGRAEIGISEYSVAQPTLEQVFLRFAREQAGEAP